MNEDPSEQSSTKVKLDRPIFWFALVTLLGFGGGLLVWREESLVVLNKLLAFMTHELGAIFLWFAFLSTIWLCWLAFSGFGAQRLGAPDSRPDYTTMSWFGMLFCAGLGSNLLYFGTMEWMWYYLDPPPGVTARTADAAVWAGAYSFFHWGIAAWSIYALATVPIAYVLHVRRSTVLRMSVACRGILGDRVDGGLGKLIDVLFIFGLVGGVGTSLGVGVPMVSAVAADLFGVTPGFALDIAVLVGLTAVFSVSVSMGLDKGIKRLSDLNVVLAIVLMVFVFLAGPTAFIINHATDSLGVMLQNFLTMSLRTGAASGSSFSADYTVFYWAWWIAWAPFMGLFVARISGGRTLKSVILGTVLGGSLGCWAGFAILGNTALNLMLTGHQPMVDLMAVDTATAVEGPLAVVTLLRSLPISGLVSAVFFVLSFIFVATSLDSAAFTLAATASRDLPHDGQPARWHRLLWAFVLGGIALALMSVGGIKVLQAASVVAGLPVLIVMVLAAVSLMRWLHEDR
ncbi:MAG: BCCT family transporter [Myxococcota bacterium]|nr:BCCT family transporter [Myxococcota bacterium]